MVQASTSPGRRRSDATLSHAGLHCQPRSNRRRQHRIAVFLGCASNSSQLGIETRRREVLLLQLPLAATIRLTSEPVAIRINSGWPFGASARM